MRVVVEIVAALVGLVLVEWLAATLLGVRSFVPGLLYAPCSWPFASGQR